MNKIKIGLASLIMILGIATVSPLFYGVASVGASSWSEILKGAGDADPDGGNGLKLDTTLKSITNLLLFVIGAISVIMIIIAGIMYTVSAGDPGKTKKAKDTLLYSIIGLVVAVLAYAIVNFVVTNIV